MKFSRVVLHMKETWILPKHNVATAKSAATTKNAFLPPKLLICSTGVSIAENEATAQDVLYQK
jgi:hypothetical protein